MPSNRISGAVHAMNLAQMIRWLALGIASLSGSLALAQSPAPISFANLPKGDSLIVSYIVGQCFGPGFEAEFLYTNRRSESFVVHRLDVSPKTKLRDRTHRTHLGEIWLEKGETAKLDAFLDYCRNPSKLKEDILYLSPGPPVFEIKQLRNGNVIAEERFSYPEKLLPKGEVIDFNEMIKALAASRSEG